MPALASDNKVEALATHLYQCSSENDSLWPGVVSLVCRFGSLLYFPELLVHCLEARNTVCGLSALGGQRPSQGITYIDPIGMCCCSRGDHYPKLSGLLSV